MGIDARDRRRRERRRAIGAACLERLEAEGFAHATLDDLALDAGLSKQNLLFYFDDKGDLWAEAVACAAEAIFSVLRRLVEGEAGTPAIRALRRALDEVGRILPAPFGVLLDGSTAPGASAHQRDRAVSAQSQFLGALARALSSPRPPSRVSHRLAHFSWLGLLANHREARTHLRSGLTPKPELAADLDWTEAQLVLLARSLLR